MPPSRAQGRAAPFGRIDAARIGLCVFACIALAAAWPHAARTAQCGLPDTSPLWIDYGDAAVPFWKAVFAHPGLIVATSGTGQASQLRAAGAQTVFFDLNLTNRVGTPTAPTDPNSIVDRAPHRTSAADRSCVSTFGLGPLGWAIPAAG